MRLFKVFSQRKPTRRSHLKWAPTAEYLESRLVLSETNVTAAVHDQVDPDVARNASGATAIVWEDLTSGSDVFARAPGSATPFQVNTSTDAYDPAVAIDGNGNFVVAWSESISSPFGLQGVIRARQYDSSGTPLGSPFLVSASTGDNSDPAIAMNPDGDFVITWTYVQEQSWVGGPNYILFKTFDASAASLTGITYVTPDGDQYDSAVAMDDEGNFVVTWTGTNPLIGSEGSDIRARHFSLGGTALTSWFTVNSSTLDDQSSSSVSMDSDGDFVVAWVSGDGSGTGICAAVFGTIGTSSTQFSVNTTTANNQSHPDVAMASETDFAIVWQGDSGSGNNDIYQQRYNGAGASGAETIVNTTTSGQQVTPAVAMDAFGYLIVVWAGSQPNSYGWDIFAS